MTATPLAIFALTDQPPWLDQRGPTALCAETDPELFFPEKGGSVREPKRLCRKCPFLAACREWALSNPVAARHGVWGGMSETERHSERERRTHTVPATDFEITAAVETREAA